MKQIDETKIKYLDMLQNVIARLNANAFAVKNWFMVSVGGLTALFFETEKIEMLALAVLMTFFFYRYDIFYLWLERCYRRKYDDALHDKCDLFDMEIGKIKMEIPKSVVNSSPSLRVYKIAGVILIALMAYKIIPVKISVELTPTKTSIVNTQEMEPVAMIESVEFIDNCDGDSVSKPTLDSHKPTKKNSKVKGL